MTPKILVANRSEIACRILNSIRELGWQSVAICSIDDDPEISKHCKLADQVVELKESGPNAYLDIGEIVKAAKTTKCHGIIPGYGFLSESSEFARAIEDEGMIFVGSSPETLQLFGDKVLARNLAAKIGVSTIPGQTCANAKEVINFARQTKATKLMLKASHGGGGKGMRLVDATNESQVESEFEACQNEALNAFGSNEMFVELFVHDAKHIEIQIVADEKGNVISLGERECSVQRSNQKLIEMTPCPTLNGSTRSELIDMSMRLAQEAQLVGLGTFEFLVRNKNSVDVSKCFFIECNPRLQVEHTVTEQVWSVDLVRTQLLIAFGKTLQELKLLPAPALPSPKLCSIQLRINSEEIKANGTSEPDSGGEVKLLQVPMGAGIRIESAAFAGFSPNPNFDSLLLKLIVTSPFGHEDVVKKARSALEELAIVGIKTNTKFLSAILHHPLFVENSNLTTRFISEHAKDLVRNANEMLDSPLSKMYEEKSSLTSSGAGKYEFDDEHPEDVIATEISGQVVNIDAKVGSKINRGDLILTVTSFKMEHSIFADRTGVIESIEVKEKQLIKSNQVIVRLVPETVSLSPVEDPNRVILDSVQVDLETYTRPELETLEERRHFLSDDFRKEKITKKRHAKGRRSARENVQDIVDPGTWIEFGDLAIAHQLGRRTLEDLIKSTQGDALVSGIGKVNSGLFDENSEQQNKCYCSVISYDYLVLAGTQGVRNHFKLDRLFETSKKNNLPLIMLTEGGGGRPNDFAAPGSGSAGLTVPTWKVLAEMNNVKIGIASGFNFAGNAALLGMCDLIICTKDANIAMAGPAMVEHSGLGKVKATDLGPARMQAKNGVVHCLVENEKEATALAKKVLSFFQGRTCNNVDSATKLGECVDQRILNSLLPLDRTKSYDMHTVLKALFDVGSMVEFCPLFGRTTIVCLARIEGIPIGILANQPLQLGGALDADGCEKASWFLDLCGRFRIPVVSMIDCPGFIVGTEFEKTGLVKYTSKLFNSSSKLTVPHFSVVLRKAVGLGAMAMAGGRIQSSAFAIAWPMSSFAGMQIEGAVMLGHKKDLEAIENLSERQKLFDFLVEKAYERGSAWVQANEFAIDTIIRPDETRNWLLRGLEFTAAKSFSRL